METKELIKKERKQISTFLRILIFIETYGEMMDIKEELEKMNELFKTQPETYTKDEIDNYRKTKSIQITTMFTVLRTEQKVIHNSIDYDSIVSTAISLNAGNFKKLNIAEKIKKACSTKAFIESYNEFLESQNLTGLV